jgi:hypothetical protein
MRKEGGRLSVRTKQSSANRKFKCLGTAVHIYIYIYIHVGGWVCVCVGERVKVSNEKRRVESVDKATRKLYIKICTYISMVERRVLLKMEGGGCVCVCKAITTRSVMSSLLDGIHIEQPEVG